ncbi:unnamed protein product (macronuclear) [Paramecium tetraurelia]|uniref:Uncharacterized protein n=1 Tax=Paramecium tetraurelia TaxID=5888 RepID=A0DP34_PARTE|nr:uncharacterized protein GSPATT00039709001 [Paramecium tetraurelia]CAK84801.1 unnamed protein product [Paramecium tetraurelia]|eukprot:XP_001452198.1 hypothetical protein (macronuclear) [Paramecium tetraurelia strain d4-2]
MDIEIFTRRNLKIYNIPKIQEGYIPKCALFLNKNHHEKAMRRTTEFEGNTPRFYNPHPNKQTSV